MEMRNKKKEFETEKKEAESMVAKSIVEQLEQQEKDDEEPMIIKVRTTNAKTSDGEKKSNIKVDASNPFNDVLNTERKETKSHKANFLLTETNFQRLSKLSEETGASRNELINKLIESCYKNSGLS